MIVQDNTILSNTDGTNVVVVFGYQYKEKRMAKEIVEIEKDTDIPRSIYRYEISDLIKKGTNIILESSDSILGNTEVDLLNIEEVGIKFNISYGKFIALISNFVAKNEIRLINLYGSNICILRTSE